MPYRNVNRDTDWDRLKPQLEASKPLWENAPAHASYLGVPNYGPYTGTWCWFDGTIPVSMELVERRPIGK